MPSSMRRRVSLSMPGGVGQVEHGVLARAKADALVLAGQKAVAPQAREDGLVGAVAAPLRDQDDKLGQVLVEAAQAVAQPGAEAGPARLLVAGLDVGGGGVVVDGLGIERFDD